MMATERRKMQEGSTFRRRISVKADFLTDKNVSGVYVWIQKTVRQICGTIMT
jgi:hypothetical protein